MRQPHRRTLLPRELADHGSGPARRWWLRAVLVGAVLTALTGATHPETPAPPPARLPALGAPHGGTAARLDAVYAANSANAALAARMADRSGDTRRAATERTLTGAHLLAFDGRGPGTAVEVLGDLTRARRVAVLVPGADTSLDTYARLHRDARSLSRAAGGGPDTAVVAWLGYRTPDTVGATVTTTTRADEAAPRLRALAQEMRELTAPGTRIVLLCHSYGSVVCGRAAPGLDVSDLVLLGSPGTGAPSAAALHTPARVWAARGSADWIARVPHIRADLLLTTVGFGADPVSPAFGAHVFDAGGTEHAHYFAPGSVSLTNVARIVTGRPVRAT
ncbi:alpha/beta hydrolase family protein [Streptomyces sp. J2-1]|uniref:alpha/beta hydrolase n=1 Tax=Streptomyces corallincola TaxID=2851888 RepID=UPI001C380001|nr:alpha/beta fold hydrolase [Streptomyces corallincola]MBV2357930.1 alpha/beta hydrolase family protein [Streptomyces corallincola]